MTHAVSNSSTGYTYQVLAAMGSMSSSDRINVYGVVTEWAAPKKTNGSDLLCTVKITDPSMVDAAAGTVGTQDLLVFAPDRAQLPLIKKPGDIIRLHRSRLNHFNNRTQLVCSLGGFKRRGPPASMCLFDSTPTAGSLYVDQPYQRSSQTYHFDAREQSILAALRAFAQSGKWSSGADQDSEKYRKSIRDIITRSSVENVQFADLIGLVLAVEENVDGPKVVWMWDGTDTPPFPPTFSTNIKPPPQQGAEEETAEQRAASILQPRPFPVTTLPPTAAAALPMIGTAVPILIRGNVTELPPPGSWAKFRNCGFQVAKGQLQGVLAQMSRWLPWREDEKVLKKYTHRLALKIVSEWYNPERSRCVSTTPHGDKEVTSLRQIAVDALQPNAENRPMAYRCIVHVLSHYPIADHVNTMCVPARASWGAAKADGYTDESQLMFALRLCVVDGTGTELDVDIFGKSGEEFFKNILHPQNLRTEPTARSTLSAALKYLTGTQEGSTPSSEPVWLDMCIKSYFPEEVVTQTEQERKKQRQEEMASPSNGMGGGALASGGGDGEKKSSLRYRVFDTKLLPLTN
ncbi:putative Telomere-binding protein 51 kDa subunit [Nannochloris sp. 'desiccata']|nr:hypothetical protein KSW81_007645 [Chlorella desiccata (nom. nud.)]KAH7618887.1 putative Telomere-binding protein 51 kDa subunit [Chlorella desiccata (nom. nud.)]